MVDFQRFLTDMGHPFWKPVHHLPAYHALDDTRLGHAAAHIIQRFYRAAVPEDGDFVGHIGNLVEFMGDDDAGDAPFPAEFLQQVQQVQAVLVIERAGGLIQDEQADVFGQRFGNFHQLLFAHADVLDEGARGFVQANLKHMLFGFLVGEVPVDAAKARLLIAQEKVFPDG